MDVTRIILTITFLFVTLQEYAQGTFQKTYGNQGAERGYQLLAKNSNEIYLLGSACNWDSALWCTSYGIRLIQIDSTGSMLKDKGFMSPNGEAWLSNPKIVLAGSNGFLIAAYRYDLMTGGSDFLLIRLNSILDTIWTRTYTCTGPIEHRAFFGDVVHCQDEGFLLVGSKNNPGVAAQDIFILKTDSNGIVEWSRTCGEQGYFNSNAHVVKETDDGFVIAGMTQSFGAGSYDIYMLKIDLNGNVLWTRTFGANTIDICFDLAIAPDNGFLLTGYTTDFSNNSDVVILKTDSNGNMNWIKSYGGDDAAVGRSILVNPDSSILVVGSKGIAFADQDDVYAIKTDFNGNLEWSKTYGGMSNDDGEDVVETSTGFFICGSTRNFSHGLEDIYLIKIANDGSLDCNVDSFLTISQTPGWIQGSGGMESNGYIVTNREVAIQNNDTASYDACVCVSPTANFFWNSNGWYEINFYNQQTWASNWHWNFGDGDTSTESNPQHAYPDTGIYIACLSVFNSCGIDTFCDSVHIETIVYEGIDDDRGSSVNISIFPNPVVDNCIIKIQSESESKRFALTLINNLGVSVWSTESHLKQFVIFDRSNLSSGLYILEVRDEKGSSKKVKLLIQ
jgi:PKD repeat protein